MEKRDFFRLLVKIVVIVSGFMLITRFVLTFYRMDGNDMFPSIRDGDLCIILRIGDPARGDIVLWTDPDGRRRLSRIVAEGGQQIMVADGGFQVDGEVMPEPVLYDTEPAAEGTIRYPYDIPEGSYFLLNDHREEKDDSRIYGGIDRDNVIGKIIFLFRRRGF